MSVGDGFGDADIVSPSRGVLAAGLQRGRPIIPREVKARPWIGGSAGWAGAFAMVEVPRRPRDLRKILGDGVHHVAGA